MTTPGEQLRREREARGLSLEDVAAATRIPVDHLVALEEDREGDLPPGPYAAAYRRSLARTLGLGTPPPAGTSSGTSPGSERRRADGPPLPSPPESLSTATIRRVAGGSALLVVALVGGLLWMRSGLEADALIPAEEVDAPDQTVRVRARQNTSLKVVVDGALAFDGELAGGDERTFAGKDRVEIDLPATGATWIEYNGESVVPQGRQDTPRRLVFVDDGSSWRSRPGGAEQATSEAGAAHPPSGASSGPPGRAR